MILERNAAMATTAMATITTDASAMNHQRFTNAKREVGGFDGVELGVTVAAIANERLVVVRARVGDLVRPRLVARKRVVSVDELHDVHAREPAGSHQGAHGRRDHAQVFRDNRQRAELLVRAAE